MLSKRTFLARAAAASAGAALPLAAWSQSDYPGKPIKLIVAFPPGGTSDVMARILAEEMGKQFKQPVVVENIGGAGGVIGMDRALKLPAGIRYLSQTV